MPSTLVFRGKSYELRTAWAHVRLPPYLREWVQEYGAESDLGHAPALNPDMGGIPMTPQEFAALVQWLHDVDDDTENPMAILIAANPSLYFWKRTRRFLSSPSLGRAIEKYERATLWQAAQIEGERDFIGGLTVLSMAIVIALLLYSAQGLLALIEPK